MNSSQIRKLNKYQAEHAFMTDNAADFPNDSPGKRTDEAQAAVIAQIQTLAGEQSSGAARQMVGLKDEKLAALIALLQKMNRAANSMADEIDGIEDLFRMPRRRSEKIWLATARAFYNDSAAHEAAFIEYELSANFRVQLQTLIGAVEAAASDSDIADEQKGGATGALDAAFREAGKNSRKLKGIVENKYADDPQKLAAWLIASHLEAAPQRKDGSTKPPA